MVELIPDDYGYVTYQGKRIKCQPGPNGTVTLPDNPFEPTSEYSLREILKDDDSDPGVFDPVRDHPRFEDLTKVRDFEGYYVGRLNPYGHWQILKRRSGQQIPQELTGSFTTLDSVKTAILKHLGKIE